MICRVAREGEEAALMALWERCFEEEPELVSALFRPLHRPGRGLVAEEGGAVCSMLLSIPVTLTQEEGEPLPAAYVYAFCTSQEARGQGIGRALLRWAEERARASGQEAVIMIPGEEGLFRFYQGLGYRRAFPQRREMLSLAGGEGRGEVQRLSPAAYGALRERLLADTPHAAYEGSVLQAQEALCRLSGGGGLYAVTLGGISCCAAAEAWPGEPVQIKELLAPQALHREAAAALCRALGRKECALRAPWDRGEGWGVVKWLTGREMSPCWFGLGLD